MQLYISHLIPHHELFKILTDYPSVGIESIEFSISSVLDQGITAIKNYSKLLGAFRTSRPFSLHGPFFDLSPASFDSRIYEVTLWRFNCTYAIAKNLGAHHIVFHSGFIPQIFYTEGWLNQSILFWKEFLKDKDESINIYLENVFDTDYRPLMELFKEISHPSFSCCLDVGHINAYSPFTCEEWLMNLAPYIGHFHLHNNDGTSDAHLGFTEGSLDFYTLMTQILKIVPHASATLELNNMQSLIHSLDFLLRHFPTHFMP